MCIYSARNRERRGLKNIFIDNGQRHAKTDKRYLSTNVRSSVKTKQNKYQKLTSKLTMVKLMKNKNNEQIIKAASEKTPFFKNVSKSNTQQPNYVYPMNQV